MEGGGGGEMRRTGGPLREREGVRREGALGIKGKEIKRQKTGRFIIKSF